MKARRLSYLLIPTLIGILFVSALLLMLSSSRAKANQASVNTSPVDSQGTIIEDTPVITIGVAVDLSGGASQLGWAEANSVQLAISQTNTAGGINVGGITYTLKLVTVDSPCFDLAQAVTAANTLVNAGAVAVVGHTCSPSSMAAQPVYYTAGVAMISPSSTRPDVTRQGYNTTFRTVTHDGTPPAMLARYFEEWLDVDTAAIVESPGNSLLGDSFSDTFTALGGTITSRRVVTDTSFYLSSLTAIMAENPDAIANLSLDPNPANAGLFSLIAYGLGMTNTVLGASSWDNNEAWLDTYATAAGEIAADGDIVVLEFRRFQDMPGWADFLADYQAAGFPNETNDPYIFGPFAYDAANIIMAAIDRADSTNPGAIRDEIAATEDFLGVVGIYEGFDPYGDVIPQWSWLEEYRSGAWNILDPTRLFLPVLLRIMAP